MQGIFEQIKKIGAAIVILILVLMMGLIFSSQPIDEVIDIISGQNQAGEFEGRQISSREYAHYYNYCRQLSADRPEDYRDYFANQCLNAQLRQAYILPRIGSRLGLDVSESFIEQKILENARWEHLRQQEEDQEDRYSLGELYRRTVASYPIDLRRRARLADKVRLTLEQATNLPEEFAKGQSYADQVRLTLRSVHYRSSQLRQKIKGRLTIPEEDVRKAYDKEEAAKEEKDRVAYSKRRKFVLDRLKEQKAAREIQELNKKLADLADLGEKRSLEKVAEITAIAIQSQQIKLTDLRNPPLKGARFDLMRPDVLKELATGNIVGPIQEGGATLYLQFSDLSLPKSFLAAERKEVPTETALQTERHPPQDGNDKEQEKDRGNGSNSSNSNNSSNSKPAPLSEEDRFLVRNFLEFIMEEEGRRGNFQVYISADAER